MYLLPIQCEVHVRYVRCEVRIRVEGAAAISVHQGGLAHIGVTHYD